jgi:hypothetical protein
LLIILNTSAHSLDHFRNVPPAIATPVALDKSRLNARKALDYRGFYMGAMQLPHFTLTKILGNEAPK